MADVKHELKSRIYSRRLAKGLDDFEIPTTNDTTTSEQLTKEDEEKRRQRRERNKVAAAKCRERKKMKVEHLSQEAENLKEENEVLTMDIRALQLEKDNLLRKLCSHHCVLTGKSRVKRNSSGDFHVNKEKTDNDSD